MVSLLDPGQCLCLVEVGTEGAGGRWDGGGREVLNEDDKRVYPVPGLVTPAYVQKWENCYKRFILGDI